MLIIYSPASIARCRMAHSTCTQDIVYGNLTRLQNVKKTQPGKLRRSGTSGTTLSQKLVTSVAAKPVTSQVVCKSYTYIT